MKYDDCHVCMACREVLVPAAGQTKCPDCGTEGELRPLKRALLEGRKLGELPDLLTEAEFAWWLQVEPVTVQSWRYEGLVPEFLRIGRQVQGPVRYDHQAIQAYLSSRRKRVPISTAAAS